MWFPVEITLSKREIEVAYKNTIKNERALDCTLLALTVSAIVYGVITASVGLIYIGLVLAGLTGFSFALTRRTERLFKELIEVAEREGKVKVSGEFKITGVVRSS